MKEIALAGTTGPIYNTVLLALLHDNRAVEVLVTDPEKVMLDTTNVTVNQFRYAKKEEIKDELTGYDTVILAYNTDYTDAANNDFILHTYLRTVNGAIEAYVKRLIVVGAKESEAFFRGELARHGDYIDSTFISTEGDYSKAVVDILEGVKEPA